jgi:hypothetical protein
MGFAALGAGLLSLSVALGALGRHRDLFADARAAELFDLALRYHALHALGLIGAAYILDRTGGAALARWGARLVALGALVFPGTLYVQAFVGDTALGRATPLGGSSLILGWALLCVAAIRGNRSVQRP